MLNNPFTIISPEDLDAELAHQLFVEVYSDFPQVKNAGHSMIVGARGSGKSMIFRCLLPDVLKLTEKCDFKDLEFIAFHIPIKNTSLKITELHALEHHHASNMINEHFFVLNILMQILTSLINLGKSDLVYNEKIYSDFLSIYNRKLRLQGCRNVCDVQTTSASEFFSQLYDHAEEMNAEFMQYLLKINDIEDGLSYKYNLPILSFHGFIVPILKALKKIPEIGEKNIYLFIDDADNLNKCQTQILNSWLSSRTTPTICLKVSTQIGKYKSFVTTNGTFVEAPHDYQEINISEKYTTSKSKYYDRIRRIVKKRLALAGIEGVEPENFFPPYGAQKEAIQKEKQRLIDSWEECGRGNRPIDDANRYAIPNYIRDLGGTRKQRSKYMYAGFETLVHLSSGVVRLFLDSAAAMYDLEASSCKSTDIHEISYSVQNQIAREKADEFLYSQFRRLETDEDVLSGNLNNVQKLQNLIFSMGKTFHDILVDTDRSERRVFSIALSHTPTQEMKDVLDLGVQNGYLHKSYIGTKDGAGRTWLYILNRYVSPIFVLDPTSFAGYLFLRNENIINAMNTGSRLKSIYELKQEDDCENVQLTIFDIGGDFDD